MSSKGELLGRVLQPRELVERTFNAGWASAQGLQTAVSVWLAESQGYERAFNDNLDANGKVVSRDCGICQINIPASEIGSRAEEDLYDPDTCLAAARKLFLARQFEPWVAFTSGVYLKPYYQARAALGIFNWNLENIVKVPVFTLQELRAKKLW